MARILGGTRAGVTPASADQTSILFVPPPPPRRPALTAVTSVRTVPGLAVRYSNKCPGAQDESPSPGASSGAEHTNPAAGGPCRPLRAASGGSACPPSAPARAPRGSARSRGAPAPHGAPKGSLDAPGRVRGAARLCPRRAALAAHRPGGRLGTRLSARPAPRPPAVLPQRLSPPASSRGRSAAAGGPEGRGGAGRASAGLRGGDAADRAAGATSSPTWVPLGAPGPQSPTAGRAPPGTSHWCPPAARRQLPGHSPSGAGESLGTRRVSTHWRGSAAFQRNGRMAALPQPGARQDAEKTPQVRMQKRHRSLGTPPREGARPPRERRRRRSGKAAGSSAGCEKACLSTGRKDLLRKTAVQNFKDRNKIKKL